MTICPHLYPMSESNLAHVDLELLVFLCVSLDLWRPIVEHRLPGHVQLTIELSLSPSLVCIRVPRTTVHRRSWRRCSLPMPLPLFDRMLLATIQPCLVLTAGSVE